jgi:GNAT superfamily N-acetyltransferase
VTLCHCGLIVNMNPIIRECKSEDLSAVLRLMRQLGEFAHGEDQFSLEHFQRLFEEMKANPICYHNLVCEVDGQVCGFLSLVFYGSFFHRVGTALINELVIDASRRGLGLGRLLIEAAITEARARGMDEVEVGTEVTNLAAQQFYKKCGFTEEYVLLGMEF